METVVALFLILNVVLVVVLAFETYFYKELISSITDIVEGLVETINVVNSNAERQDNQEKAIEELQKIIKGKKA